MLTNVSIPHFNVLHFDLTDAETSSAWHDFVLLYQENKSKNEHKDHDQQSPQVSGEKILVSTIKSCDEVSGLLHTGNDKDCFSPAEQAAGFPLKIWFTI